MIEYFAVPNVGGQVVDARTLVGDRAIAVVGKDRASGYVFDLETKKVAFALPAGTTPYRLFVDDANNLLYFASEVDVKKTRFVGVRVDFDDYHAVANGSPGGADATPLTATLEGLKR